MDSFYTVTVLFLVLPELAEDVGQVWGWATYGVGKGALDNPVQYRQVTVWNARAGTGLTDLQESMERAVKAKWPKKPQRRRRARAGGLRNWLAAWYVFSCLLDGRRGERARPSSARSLKRAASGRPGAASRAAGVSLPDGTARVPARRQRP